MRQLIIAITILFISNTCFADNIQPTMMHHPNFISIRLESFDLYELAAGYLWYGDHFGYGMNIEGNHNKIGYENIFFYKEAGEMHSTKAFFLRPKIEYYFNKEDVLNFYDVKEEVYGIDVGIGGSGHSPLINIYAGGKYSPKYDSYDVYIGIGINP